MRVLLIKTSSMGDIIHTLPALTQALKNIPEIRIDWLVEESFQEIPHWHAAVDRVIPVAIRRWRKMLFARRTLQEWRALKSQLHKRYDLIIDAQGLMKSAFLSLFTRGPRIGPNWGSAREPLASLFYRNNYVVDKEDHAIARMSQIFAQALHYPLSTQVDYQIQHAFKKTAQDDYLVLLHGTTWKSKEWPEANWKGLVGLAKTNGLTVVIGGGNAAEVERAQRIAAQSSSVRVMPYLSIGEMAQLLVNAKGVVAVDTGFGHLSAALNVPTVSLYGATSSRNTGTIGHYAENMSVRFKCAPCFKRKCQFKTDSPPCYSTLTPEHVFQQLQILIDQRSHPTVTAPVFS